MVFHAGSMQSPNEKTLQQGDESKMLSMKKNG
jgi:hypothetical protein